jgi:hypothetical protein
VFAGCDTSAKTASVADSRSGSNVYAVDVTANATQPCGAYIATCEVVVALLAATSSRSPSPARRPTGRSGRERHRARVEHAAGQVDERERHGDRMVFGRDRHDDSGRRDHLRPVPSRTTPRC